MLPGQFLSDLSEVSGLPILSPKTLNSLVAFCWKQKGIGLDSKIWDLNLATQNMGNSDLAKKVTIRNKSQLLFALCRPFTVLL